MKLSYSLLILIAITSFVLAANIVNEVNESTIAEEKGEVYLKCYKAFKLIENTVFPLKKIVTVSLNSIQLVVTLIQKSVKN